MEETDKMQCMRELNVTQVLSRIVPEKRRSRKEEKSVVIGRLPPNAVLHPALLNRKNQLPHAVPR